MYLADYHVHSSISPDARHSMTELAQAAVQAGLDELCFTDHVEPIVWGSTQLRETGYDWEAVKREFAAAQDAWGDRIKLRLGAELGDAPWSFATSKDLIETAPELDFVIGSIHMLSEKFGGVDLYFFDPKDEEEARAGIADYLLQVRKLARWGRFTVLGHLTLPLRYLNENKGFHLTFDGFEEEVAQVFRLLLEGGCGIELNTNRGNTPLPDEKWLRMYREMGGKLITLGTDAHDPAHVGCAIREGQDLLRRCGFTKYCTFEKQMPIWHEL